jgi:hypothetical protein
MNPIELISSVSKVAIGAFVITLIVVGYVVFLLMRRKQHEQLKEDKHITLPDFNEGEVKQGTFSPIAVDPIATQPVEIQSRKVSKPFLGMLLGLLALIVLITGFLIYKRNQVANVRVDEVSPIGKSQSTPIPTRSQAQIPTVEPTGTEIVEIPTSTPATGANITTIPTTSVLVVTTSPTSSVSVTTTQASPTSSSSAEATEEPDSTTLPQAGSYQTTLIISIVAIAIIYLALIL